jgi:hypothetical protein
VPKVLMQCSHPYCVTLQVFGSAERLGTQAVNYTIDGYLRADPELRVWRSAQSAWWHTLRRVCSVMHRRDMQLRALPGMLVSSTFNLPLLSVLTVTQCCCTLTAQV